MSQFRQLDVDIYFAKKAMFLTGLLTLFPGVMEPKQRIERVRAFINHYQLAEKVINSTGRPQTWRQVFERGYGQKLSPESKPVHTRDSSIHQAA